MDTKRHRVGRGEKYEEEVAREIERERRGDIGHKEISRVVLILGALGLGNGGKTQNVKVTFDFWKMFIISLNFILTFALGLICFVESRKIRSAVGPCVQGEELSNIKCVIRWSLHSAHAQHPLQHIHTKRSSQNFIPQCND